VPTFIERRREIFIENRKENIRVTEDLSLTTLNGENLNFS